MLDVHDVRPVLVPADCVDGFGAAFWCRPEAYTDPAVQAGMSWLAQLPADDLALDRRGCGPISPRASGTAATATSETSTSSTAATASPWRAADGTIRLGTRRRPRLHCSSPAPFF